MGSQTVTEWRIVGEDHEPGEDPYRDVGGWTTEQEARKEADAFQFGAVPCDAVYLEKRTVTYGPVVRVELSEASGDVRGDE